MKHTQRLLTHIGAVALSVSCFSLAAHAAGEAEPNSSASSAQVVDSSSGDLSVSGSLAFRGMDPRTRQPIRDVDFYSFHANAGDRLDVAVSGMGSSVALFGDGPGFSLLATGDASARVSGHTVAKNGMYTVAVANSKAFFSNGGYVNGGSFEEGSYALSVSGFAKPALEISIKVKPRKRGRGTARIKLWKKDRVKVAILGSKTFKVADVDTSSLRFGAKGDEKTLRKCKRRFKDVNRDGYRDLVCKFGLKDSGFTADSGEAVLTGYTKGGAIFHARDEVVVRESKKVAHWSKKRSKKRSN
jgi:hypothetical protein